MSKKKNFYNVTRNSIAQWHALTHTHTYTCSHDNIHMLTLNTCYCPCLCTGLLPAWSLGQSPCNANQMQSCSSGCESCYDNCQGITGSRCCPLDLPNNYQQDTDNYPLGFQLVTLPGSDEDRPDPCLRIEYTVDEVNSTTNVNYLILAVSGGRRGGGNPYTASSE